MIPMDARKRIPHQIEEVKNFKAKGCEETNSPSNRGSQELPARDLKGKSIIPGAARKGIRREIVDSRGCKQEKARFSQICQVGAACFQRTPPPPPRFSLLKYSIRLQRNQYLQTYIVIRYDDL